MEHRLFGKTNLSVSVLGFGTSEIGSQKTPQDDVNRLVATAIDSGVNVIDTAAAYWDSEEKLGAALADKRDKVLLFSKVGYEDGFSKEDWSVASLLRCLERSLKRLKTDHLDLVQVHSCKWAELADGKIIEALEQARQQGKTRFIGYSGDGPDALSAINSGKFDTLQTSVNVADQKVLDSVLPAAAKRQMGVIAKRPIANAAWRYTSQPENGYHIEYWKRLTALDYGWAKKPMEEASGIALRFTLSQPGVHTAIVGTPTPRGLRPTPRRSSWASFRRRG
jgi:aryl-alcohol dehydrogenase-like predicted oxidoreductase